MMKTGILVSIYTLFFLITLAYSAEQKDYYSPDGRYHAFVIALPGTAHGSGENKVIIKTKAGKTLCSKSYGSKDGEHGFRVEKAQWTLDSRFFVYSMSSSGGHQPWHSPVYFISIRDQKVRSLDDYVGAVTEPDFKLRGTDTIKAVATEGTLDKAAVFEVSLSVLVAREKKR